MRTTGAFVIIIIIIQICMYYFVFVVAFFVIVFRVKILSCSKWFGFIVHIEIFMYLSVFFFLPFCFPICNGNFQLKTCTCTVNTACLNSLW